MLFRSKGVISTDGTRTGVYGFDYSVNGKEITLAYMDKTGKLSVSEATLMFDGFGNVLTVKSAGSEIGKGNVFRSGEGRGGEGGRNRGGPVHLKKKKKKE